jgi:hypothetical protein
VRQPARRGARSSPRSAPVTARWRLDLSSLPVSRTVLISIENVNNKLEK